MTVNFIPSRITSSDWERATGISVQFADPNFVAVGLIQHRLFDFCRCGHGEFVAVCLLPRNDGIAQNADLLDLAFDDVSGL